MRERFSGKQLVAMGLFAAVGDMLSKLISNLCYAETQNEIPTPPQIPSFRIELLAENSFHRYFPIDRGPGSNFLHLGYYTESEAFDELFRGNL